MRSAETIGEREILLWAAGAPVRLPQIAATGDERILYLLGIDEERLLRLIVDHRLAARFLWRYRQERPGWCSSRLLGAVLEHEARARRRRHLHLDAMREIARAPRSEQHRPVVIKGFSTYALTGDDRHVHFSDDMDLSVEDPEGFERVLTGLGYTREGHPSPHEYAKMRRGEVMIEPHRYVPVWQYPPGLVQSDLVAARHRGCWFQDFVPRSETRITHADILAHTLAGMAPGTEGLSVPTPAMSALLLASHEFWAVVRFEYRAVTVRLATIAAIHDLVCHPLFDPVEFRSLVERFRAHDAVAFAGHMLGAMWGRNPLRAFVRRARRLDRDGFPVILHPQGCWAAFHTADDFIVPRNMGETLLQHVGTTQIAASAGGEAPVYRFGGGSMAPGAQRLIVQSSTRQTLPLEVAVRWGESDLSFDVGVREPLRTDADRLKVHVCIYDGGFSRYFATVCDRGRRLLEFAQGRARHSVLPDGYRVQMDFPWWLLRHDIVRKSPLPATVAVSRWREENETSVLRSDPIMLVPLSIYRGAAPAVA